MFPSLASRETIVTETILLLEDKQLNKQIFFFALGQNIFASRTKILPPNHMFPSLATMKTMLTCYRCCSFGLLGGFLSLLEYNNG